MATNPTTTAKARSNAAELAAEPSGALPPSSSTFISLLRPAANDPSLKSTWTHRAWLACGCIAVLVALAKSVAYALESHIWAAPLFAGAVGYALADLGSGVYHWVIDNYGDASSPVFGAQIEGFQGHHNYCIVSGIWNEFLDNMKVFEKLEMVLFFIFGLRPRSWNETNSKWIEESVSS